MAYVGTLIAYSIVLLNSYQPFSNKQPYFKQMLLDENFQYYIIALYFTFAKRRIAVSLLPFFIYALFHVLEYTHSNIIPHFASHRTTLQVKIKRLVDMHYDTSIKLVSKIEIYGVMTRLIFGFFMFKSTLLSILVYGQFLRMRYYMSENSRECFNTIGRKVDDVFAPTTGQAKVPSAVSEMYIKVRNIVTKQATKKKQQPAPMAPTTNKSLK
ncbi:hypothetical protein BDF20DRAFT_823089 [Mycotypha africana]|uniref:uncharacterized protein n=1 Tax=Mycotypha africana TaxID=64632 RepID=UPI002300FF96|nr:uncharacterized protein BDF20DRAFT_823089 [Mycotypha africana]KAI8975049.1 hypothetical protein BDF20DRAFT_823089 [Mycotypha africana]